MVAGRPWTLFPVAAATFIVATFVGWHPYVTNTVSSGHPFYPMAGVGALDFKPFLPQGFERMNRFEKLAASVFSTSSNGIWIPDEAGKVHGVVEARLKLPFFISEEELSVFKAPDVRLGGFGPLFSAVATWRSAFRPGLPGLDKRPCSARLDSLVARRGRGGDLRTGEPGGMVGSSFATGLVDSFRPLAGAGPETHAAGLRPQRAAGCSPCLECRRRCFGQPPPERQAREAGARRAASACSRVGRD